MPLDRHAYCENIRKQLGHNLASKGRRHLPERRTGVEAILDVWERDYADTDPAWLAYVMATAWHETGTCMAPLREGFAVSDEQAFDRVQKHIRDHGLNDYVSRKANGHSYYGRGFVQLTWDDNYKKMGAALGVGDQFYDNPDLVMDPAVSAKIIWVGMEKGLFRRGHHLARYFGADHYDWHSARLMVNGRRSDGSIDRAAEIAEHGRKFLSAFEAAWIAAPAPAVAPNPAPAPSALPVPDSGATQPTHSAPTASPVTPAPTQSRSERSARRTTDKPLSQSRTIWAALAAGLAAAAEFARSAFSSVNGLFQVPTPWGVFNGMWVLAGVVFISLLTIIYVRVDDRRRRGR